MFILLGFLVYRVCVPEEIKSMSLALDIKLDSIHFCLLFTIRFQRDLKF